MDAQGFTALRKHLGLTQTEMGGRMGVAMRTVQDLESGASRIKAMHVAAAERIALDVALERQDPMLAPASVCRQALDLARLVTVG